MSLIFLIVGFAFVFAGFLSLTGLTDVGMDYVTFTQLHTLPYLNEFPASWVYTGAGIILLLLAYTIGSGRKRR